MEETLQFIKTEIDRQRDIRQKLAHDLVVARKLAFQYEANKIEADRVKAMEIIELLQKIEKKLQNNT